MSDQTGKHCPIGPELQIRFPSSPIHFEIGIEESASFIGRCQRGACPSCALPSNQIGNASILHGGCRPQHLSKHPFTNGCDVTCEYMHALLLEMPFPSQSIAMGNEVCFVEDHDTWLLSSPAPQLWMHGGDRNPCISHFDHEIHGTQFLAQILLHDANIAGIPFDRRFHIRVRVAKLNRRIELLSPNRIGEDGSIWHRESRESKASHEVTHGGQMTKEWGSVH